MNRGAVGSTHVITKPPKPPCWRDFMSRSASDSSFKPDFTNISKIAKTTNVDIGTTEDVTSIQRPWSPEGTEHAASTRSGRHGRRTRTRIHRTRSQLLIDERDLPGGDLTVNLSDTKSSECGLRKQFYDSRIYSNENKKRCQIWLEDLAASAPLDDVAFTKGSGVDIEIPEECWEDRCADTGAVDVHGNLSFNATRESFTQTHCDAKTDTHVLPRTRTRRKLCNERSVYDNSDNVMETFPPRTNTIEEETSSRKYDINLQSQTLLLENG